MLAGVGNAVEYLHPDLRDLPSAMLPGAHSRLMHVSLRWCSLCRQALATLSALPQLSWLDLSHTWPSEQQDHLPLLDDALPPYLPEPDDPLFAHLSLPGLPPRHPERLSRHTLLVHSRRLASARATGGWPAAGDAEGKGGGAGDGPFPRLQTLLVVGSTCLPDVLECIIQQLERLPTDEGQGPAFVPPLARLDVRSTVNSRFQLPALLPYLRCLRHLALPQEDAAALASHGPWPPPELTVELG